MRPLCILPSSALNDACHSNKLASYALFKQGHHHQNKNCQSRRKYMNGPNLWVLQVDQLFQIPFAGLNSQRVITVERMQYAQCQYDGLVWWV